MHNPYTRPIPSPEGDRLLRPVRLPDGRHILWAVLMLPRCGCPDGLSAAPKEELVDMRGRVQPTQRSAA